MTYELVKRDLRRAYDRMADAREGMADAEWKQRERERFGELLRQAGAASLLEIGAGHGISGRFFADHGFAVTCIDLSPELVARCREKGLTAAVMDFAALTFPAASFDAAFGMNCLLHVPRADLDEVLRSVRGVLAPGGMFYWGQYGGRRFEGTRVEDDYQPKRYFSFLTHAEIQQAAGRVFDVVDFRWLPLDGDGFGYQALVLRRRNGSAV